MSVRRAVFRDDTTHAYDDGVTDITSEIGGGGSYTDEQAQDAVGGILADGTTIDFTYNDGTPSITAEVKDASLAEGKLILSDNTTNDASTSNHGLLRKLDGNSAHFLAGDGSWGTPSGTGSYTDEQAQDAVGGMLADTDTIDLTYTDATPSLTAALKDTMVRSNGSSTSGTPGTSVASITASASHKFVEVSVLAAQSNAASTQLTVTVTFSDSSTLTTTTAAAQAESVFVNDAGYIKMRGGAGLAQDTTSTKLITAISVVTAGAGTGSRMATIAAREVPQ